METALFSINIIVFFIILLWPILFSIRNLSLPFLNPITIIFILNFPIEIMKIFVGPYYLLDEGLFDFGYQISILIASSYNLSIFLGTIFLYKFIKSKIGNIRFTEIGKINDHALLRCEFIFILLFLASFILIASSDYGLVNWLMNPRQGYQLYRVGNGPLYSLAVNFLGLAYISRLIRVRSPKKIIFACFLYAGIAYFLGSKGYFLVVLSTALIFLWFIRWDKLSTFLFLSLPLFAIFMVFNLYLAIGSSFNIYSIAEYFDHYKNSAMYYKAIFNGDITYFYGDVFFTSFWAYIPRVFYSDKPFVYGVLLVNEIFFPGQAELTNTPAFGGAVEQFADFGILGVMFTGFFGTQSISIALLSFLTFKNPGIDLNRLSLLPFLILIIQYSPGFGAFMPGILYLLFLTLVCAIIYITRPGFWYCRS